MCFGQPQSQSTLTPLYVVNDWYFMYKNNLETASSYKLSCKLQYIHFLSRNYIIAPSGTPYHTTWYSCLLMKLSDEYGSATTTVPNPDACPPRNRNRDGRRADEVIFHNVVLRFGAIYTYFTISIPCIRTFKVRYRHFKNGTLAYA